MIDFMLSQGVSTMIPLCFNFRCLHATRYCDLHLTSFICTYWYHDNLVFVCRWSQQRVSSRILLMHFCALLWPYCPKIYYQGLEIWSAFFFSVISRFPNMKGFYWAVRLSQAINYLAQAIPQLSQAISWLSLKLWWLSFLHLAPSATEDVLGRDWVEVMCHSRTVCQRSLFVLQELTSLFLSWAGMGKCPLRCPSGSYLIVWKLTPFLSAWFFYDLQLVSARSAVSFARTSFFAKWLVPFGLDVSTIYSP